MSCDCDCYEDPCFNCEDKDTALHLARYYISRVRFKTCADRVLSGQMKIEEVNEYMRLAIENYDQIIESADSWCDRTSTSIHGHDWAAELRDILK